MTTTEFWNVIERARSSATNTVEIPDRLVDGLSGMPDAQIIGFGLRFRECMDWSFDARLWLAAVVLLGGCGDDAFSDFRGWLIAQGRSAFESALAEPDSLAQLPSFEGTDGYPRLEKMLYVDKNAFLKRAGSHDFETVCRYEQLLPRRQHPALKSRELIHMSYEQAKGHLPQLAARFPTSIREARLR
jgi:hypothetical protein